MGAGSKRHALATLPLGVTRYPMHRRLRESQARSERVRKISPLPEFDPRTVQPVANCCADNAIPAIYRYR
jgi:hypothetical protein